MHLNNERLIGWHSANLWQSWLPVAQGESAAGKKAELLLGKSSSIQFFNKQNSIRILANGREPHDSNFEITEY